MRPIGVAMAFCLSAYGLAQGLSVSGSAGSGGGNGFSTMNGGGSIVVGGVRHLPIRYRGTSGEALQSRGIPSHDEEPAG